MTLSAITEPHFVTAAYSAIPLRVTDSEIGDYENYKYITNIFWDLVVVTQTSPYPTGSFIYTQCSGMTEHNFKLGDELLLDGTQSNSGLTGYYFITNIIDEFNFVINQPFNLEISNNYFIGKVIKHSNPPDIHNEVKLDLSNTIKNKCTENLVDVPEIYAAPDTRFRYNLRIGNSYDYALHFDQLVPTGNTASFIITGATSVDDVEFNVGDIVNITTNPIEWPYLYAYNNGSNQLSFSGTSAHGTPLGSTFNVTGQIANPQFNGLKTKAFSVQPPNAVVSSQSVQGTPVQEPGVIFFNTPVGVTGVDIYNTTTNITSIVYIPGTGVVINTKIVGTGDFGWDSIFSGEIRRFGGSIVEFPNLLDIDGLNAFSNRFSDFNYGMVSMDRFVCQVRANNLNFLSTILTPATKYRVEKSTKGWLLCHNYVNDYVNRARYDFYDIDGGLLGWLTIPNNTIDKFDFYIPMGIYQVQASTTRVDGSGTFNTYVNDIDSYQITGAFNTNYRTNTYNFKVNDDCSAYSVNHLMWKDSNGSWISMPFIYKSYDEIEVERSTYYQRKGDWSNNTFIYNKNDKGEKQFFTRSRKKKILNSGWLEDFEIPLIKDLFESASVYLQDKNGNLLACVIEQDTKQLMKSENEELMQYEFEIRMANNNYRF